VEQLRGIRLQDLAADQAVEILALAPGFDYAGAHQLLDVVRDGGFGDGKLIPEMLTGATFLVGDSLEDGDPSRVGQRLGDELELAGRKLARSHVGAHGIIVIELSHDCQARADA
jgi:hypothetical protein